MTNDSNKPPVDRRRFLTGCGCMTVAGLAAGMIPLTLPEIAEAQSRGRGGNKNPMLTEIAYCGLFCGGCGGLQDTVKAGGQKEGGCLGCKSNVLGGHCAKCKVRECAMSKSVANCGLCADYPCEKIKEYHNDEKEGTYMAVARKNSEDFMVLGNLETDDEWSEKQLQRWTCPKCKTPFHFRSGECPKCGGKIATVETEANIYGRRKTPGFIEFEGNSWQNNLAYKTTVQKFAGKNALNVLGHERTLVFRPEVKFRDGTIECDVCVKTCGGLAFRVSEDGAEAEIVQLHFVNTKKDKNKKLLMYCHQKHWHTGWRELRKEHPGKYDTETKLLKDKWFHLKLAVQGKTLDIFIDDASEPALSVETLGKRDEGAVGIFGAEARFANFKIG